MYRCFNTVVVAFSRFHPQSRLVCAARTNTPTLHSPRCVFEVLDRAGQRVYVGTAASKEAAVVPTSVQKFAGGGCEVRKVREVEGGRDALLAAKAAIVQESVASGCSLLNDRVKCAPFLYEVVDEAERRVFVGVSRNMYGTNHVLQQRGVLCDGRVVRKVRNVPVGMSAAEAKYDLIAESVASGCRLLNSLGLKKTEKQMRCVFELVDRAGQRVFVGTAASMEAAVAQTLLQKFTSKHEVRKVCEVEGGRDALLAAKAAIIAESVASGCSLLNQSVACAPFLYEVVDEAECRVFVGVSRNMYDTNHDLQRSGVLCDGRVVRKVRNVPVGMSAAEAKADLIAESVASGCRLLNTRRQRGKEKQAGCVFELVDRAGQRVFVGTAASMEAAVAQTLLQKFTSKHEVRKVCEVEGGRDALLAAKTAVVQESVASGCSLLNDRVQCAPFLYEVVDEAERRVSVGVSRNMYGTNHVLQQRGVLCDGRVVRKVRNIPVGMSAAEAKYDLIAESVASGCRLLNTRRQRGKEKQAGCVFELVDRAGQRVFVGTAASMEAAVAQTLLQKFTRKHEVRKVCEVEGGRDALLAAKAAIIAESVASGCSLLNDRVQCAPFLYEVVDEAERRVFVGVSRNMYGTNHDLQRSGRLCDGRVVRKVRNIPVGMSAAEAKADLIAESVASGYSLENADTPYFDGDSLQMSVTSRARQLQPQAFHSKHAATLELHRVGPCPTSRDEGVVYALYDDSLSVVYVGQTQFSAVRRAKTHVRDALRTDRKRKTRLHAAMLRHGKPFHVAPLEKIDVRLSCRRTFREIAGERERHYISVLKPTLNTVFRRLACTGRPQ